MRKALLSLACLALMCGFTLAVDVTLLNYDPAKKVVTVKEGDAEKTYRLTDKTKVLVLKDGKAEDSTVDTAIKILRSDRAKGKLKFDITTEEDSIAVLKLRPRKRK